jgi:hypothetical protein
VFLIDKYVAEHEIEYSSLYGKPKIFEEQKQIENNQDIRKSRPDSMNHYPFIDEFGSVEDVLSGQDGTGSIDLSKIGAPGRKRLIEKVFHEMRFDGNGIRLSDLPEALYRLGILLSSELRNTLLQAKSKLVDGPIIRLDNEYHNVNEESIEYMEKHIPFQLWMAIVRRFLRLKAQGIDSRDVHEIFPNISLHDQHGNQTNASTSKYYENIDHTDIDENANIYHTRTRENESMGETETDEQYEDDEDKNQQQILKKKREKRTKKQKDSTQFNHRKSQGKSQQNHNPVVRRERDYYNQLNRVTSRISNLVQFDRKNYHDLERSQDRAALTSVARNRIHHLNGWQDSSYQQHLQSQSQVLSQSAAHKYMPKSYTLSNRLRDLESGSATMEIANAFLKGNVGKELMSNPDDDFEEYIRDEINELSPKEAQIKAAEMLGMM